MLHLVRRLKKKKNQFILDNVSVSSSVAYSLRKLKNNYTGSAIKVRRSSDNAELDIGFVNGELDTATLLAHANGGDCFVTTWYDQSGNGNNAAQTTAGNQPMIVNTGSIGVSANGKPVIQFLRSSSTYLQTINNITNDANLNVYLHLEDIQNDSTSNIDFYRINSSGTAGVFYLFYANSNRYTLFNGSNLSSTVTGAGDSGIFSVFQGASAKIYRNGVQIVSGNSGTNSVTGKMNIGTGNSTTTCATFKTSEHMIYNTHLTDTDRNKIEQSQSKFYGITIA